jgi:hypothetical protein
LSKLQNNTLTGPVNSTPESASGDLSSIKSLKTSENEEEEQDRTQYLLIENDGVCACTYSNLIYILSYLTSYLISSPILSLSLLVDKHECQHIRQSSSLDSSLPLSCIGCPLRDWTYPSGDESGTNTTAIRQLLSKICFFLLHLLALATNPESMSVFYGDRNEDPKEFLNLYLNAWQQEATISEYNNL